MSKQTESWILAIMSMVVVVIALPIHYVSHKLVTYAQFLRTESDRVSRESMLESPING